MKRILRWVAVAIGGCLALLLVVGVVWEQVERSDDQTKPGWRKKRGAQG